jgi:hypothetical protein
MAAAVSGSLGSYPLNCLAKLFLGCVQIFSGALVRLPENYVGGHMKSLIANRLPLQTRYAASSRRKPVSTGALRNFAGPSFLSFATQSPTKLPRRPFAIEAVMGQEEAHAPQQTYLLGSAGSNRPPRQINSAVSV